MKFVYLSSLLVASLSPVGAFAPMPVARLPVLQKQLSPGTLKMREDDEFDMPKMPDMPEMSMPDIEMPDFLSSVDLSGLGDAGESLISGLTEGDIGSRGEAYFAATLAVFLVVIGGGIPYVGGALITLTGLGSLIAGVGAVVVALSGLGKSASVFPATANSNPGLVTDGIYGEMRHPFYAGLLGICLGFSILSGSAARLVFTGALLYVLDVVAEYEEKDLMKAFPEYSSYKAKTPGKFFPDSALAALPWSN